MSHVRTLEGKLTAEGCRFALVASRFNGFICEQLIQGAIDGIVRLGGEREAIEVVRVPGAFEIPGVAKKVCQTGRYDAVICLGVVIRGATPHFDYVAGEASKGIAQLQLSEGIPVTYGVLTTDTIEQAIERAGTKAGNKGFDAAMAAIELVNLYRVIETTDAR